MKSATSLKNVCRCGYQAISNGYISVVILYTDSWKNLEF